MMPPSQAVFEALWAAVIGDFKRRDLHAAFVQHCQDADRLLDAATRYSEHRQRLEGLLKELDASKQVELTEFTEQCLIVDGYLETITLLTVLKLDVQPARITKRQRALLWLAAIVSLLIASAFVGFIRALLA